MTRFRAILSAVLFFTVMPALVAQQQTGWEVEALTPEGGALYDFRTGIATGTNGVLVKYGGVVLTADRVSVNQRSGEAVADGQVRIQSADQIWAGEHIRYNFKTGEIVTEQFRTGKAPIFAGGSGLQGQLTGTNRMLEARGALVTTDDVSEPAIKVRARRIKIIPGERVEATHAVLYLGDVPVFYFPYYARNLGPRSNNFTAVPGYRSRYGPYLLGTYQWFLNEHLDGELHLDYRERRGVGAGPDFNYHFGRWGRGSLRYYYAHDEDPSTNFMNAPVFENRQRLYFSYLATPFTNVEVRSLVQYQNDPGVVRDFFVGDYRQNPQPNTFFDLEKFWQNFSLDVHVQPRVNNFYETVERLPEVKLTGYRQPLGKSPLYYESESSLGYYRRLFAETNLAPPGLNFEAARADTYHQLTLPITLFGWLNLAPRVGGRATYYSDANGPGGIAQEKTRTVFNTGAEMSFKASQLWPGVRSEVFQLHGVRHIIEPSVNYVYVPEPSHDPSRLPQFDYELASLRLLPIEYPDYNAIDSVDSQNVLRLGLRNRLQTKRGGVVEDFLRWEIFTDWRLRTRTNQFTFADVYSDLTFKPQSWLRLDSQTRFDPNLGQWRMLLHTVTLEPNDVWHWTVGHFYLRSDPGVTADPRRVTGLGQGNDLITSSMYYRLNENWGLRARHHYDLRGGRMQEQFYTVYRDLRSWTAALTAGLRDNGVGPKDFTIAFTFSLKAAPRYAVGADTVLHDSLLGR